MNLFGLTGKTAMVIGGNSTLGSEMAAGLAGHGAKVAIAGRNRDTAGRLCKRTAISQDRIMQHIRWTSRRYK